MALPTINIPNFAGISTVVPVANSGRQADADSSAVALSTEGIATLGGLTETAPASDTASSGLNGRLQRIAQRITSLIALLPASLGTKTAAASLPVTLASDGQFVTTNGSPSDAAWASGNGSLVALLKTLATAALSTSPSAVILPGKYATVAASATAQALGSGAIGDYISHVTIIPATTSPGAISIKDGAGSAITIFAGGASSVSNLVPFPVPLGLISTAGGWTITTGTNVSAIAEGKF